MALSQRLNHMAMIHDVLPFTGKNKKRE